jgi:preprotein translocase subunit Sec61beta
MTTGATAPCSYRDPETGVLITGCTATTKYLIPNTGVTYYVKFCLTQDAQDIGFFDAYMLDSGYTYIQLSGATSAITEQNIRKFEQVLSGGTTLAASGLVQLYDNGYITGTTITPTYITITGHSSSRLVELRKYVISGTTAQIYVTGGTSVTDGIVLSQSTGNTIVYFLGGIRYVDTFTGYTSGTTFTFIGQGLSNPNFINKPIYKDMNKENIISNPKIYNDVFIVRQEVSAFDGNYRLEYIQSLVDLTTYAGGNFFNIVNNT